VYAEALEIRCSVDVTEILGAEGLPGRVHARRSRRGRSGSGANFVALVASLSRASPERFRPSNSLASGGSAASGLPVPVKRSSGEVMLAAYDPQFRLRDDAGRESVATLHALQPFGTAVDGRIDTTPQARIQRI